MVLETNILEVSKKSESAVQLPGIFCLMGIDFARYDIFDA